MTTAAARAIFFAGGLILMHGCALAQTVVLYARADAAQAERLRQVVAAYDTVFIDRDLQPGADWRPSIASQIKSARRVMVLWSSSAASSMELGAEWRMALAWGVPVVPVLLDDTTLPDALGRLQGIDWR